VTGTAGRPERLSSCRGYWTTWAAFTVSDFGTYVSTLAIQVLIVVTLHGTATEVGSVNAARWLPYLLFGLLAGALVDRVRRRPLLIFTDFARGALLLLIPVLAVTHSLQLVTLMSVMALFGLLSLFGDAALQSFVPRLVPPRLLSAANARLDQSDAVAQVSGPALAGGLVSLMGAAWAVVIDAISYVVSGALLWRVRVDEPRPAARPATRRLRTEIAEGLRWIYRNATLRAMAIGTHGWFLCSALVGAVSAPFALETLRLSAAGLGLALAVAGIGALIGALAAVRLGEVFGAGHVVVVANGSNGVAWAVMAMAGSSWPGWIVFGAGQLTLGLGMGASNPNEMGYRQAVTPDGLQGRTNATIRSINRAMVVVGAPVGGVLGDALGYRTVLWIAAVGVALVAGLLACSPFRSARIDEHMLSGRDNARHDVVE
jgi:MFS family permease